MPELSGQRTGLPGDTGFDAPLDVDELVAFMDAPERLVRFALEAERQAEQAVKDGSAVGAREWMAAAAQAYDAVAARRRAAARRRRDQTNQKDGEMTLDDCRECEGFGSLDVDGDLVCDACEGSGWDRVWREGRNARRHRQPRTSNPYKRSPDAERWAAGWMDANASIGAVIA